ncbi:MAG: AAA family ATPase [Granulosicoccus sp.]
MSAHDALDHDHSGLLSDAALSALNLHHQPFSSQLRDASAPADGDADAAAESFTDALIEEQLADIKQALITGDDLLLILGENGSGKTTLVQQLSANSGLRIQCFSVTGSERFSTLNLFAGMLEAFQRSPSQKLKEVLDELTPCLQSMAARNTLSVIVLDDAHKVNQTELTQLLSGMLYMNSQDETLIRIAFAATSDFEDTIPDLLPEGADLPYSSLTIEGFSPPRAAAYLDYRLGLAGFDQEFPFTERDMASLVDHSDGRPSELHALTADVLNEKYGRLDDVPKELVSDKGEGFLSSRKGKFALGAAATLLILGGLLMFLPQGEQQDRRVPGERINLANQDSASEPQAPELKLIDTSQSGSDVNSQTSTENADAATSNAASQQTTPEATPSEPAPTDSDTLRAPAVDASDTDSEPADTSNNVEVPASTTTEPEPTSSEPIEETDEIAATDASESDSTDVASTDNDEAVTDESATEPLTVADTAPSGPDQTTDETPTEQATATANQTDNQEADVETSPDTTEDASTNSGLEDLLESPNWVLVQNEEYFTIQMSASRDLASVQNFLRRNPLPLPNSIFSFEREGDIWFALVHGIFPTFSEAQRAVESMSDSAQRDQPWIRSITRVKEILRQE